MFGRRPQQPATPPPSAAPAAPAPTATAAVEMVRPVITVRTLVTSAMLVLVFVGLVMALALIGGIILLLLVAIVFAEGIRSSVHRVEKLHVPQPAAVLIVYILLLAILAILIGLLVQPIVAEVQSFSDPKYQQQIIDGVANIQHKLHVSTSKDISTQIIDSLTNAKEVLLAIGGYVLNIIVNFVVVLILGFLWLMTSDRLKVFIVDLFPASSPASPVPSPSWARSSAWFPQSCSGSQWDRSSTCPLR